MKSPFSENEVEILGRQVNSLGNQLDEIAQLLEARLGPSTEWAAYARVVHREFTAFAGGFHAQLTGASGARQHVWRQLPRNSPTGAKGAM